MFDVGVSNIVQIGNAAEIAEIEKSGVIRDKVAPQWFMNYRHAIDIDGNTNSWSGLFTKLIMGNTVLKVDSSGGYRQWYYDRLIPWRNFIPISSTMVELFEVGYWLRTHPSRAREIALAGNQLAASLTAEASLADAATAVASAIGSWPNIDPARGVIPSARPAVPPEPETLRQTKESSPTSAFITQTEVPPAHDLVTKVRESFARASMNNSAIDPGVLKIPGMSGLKYRRFINNLVRSLEDASYMEVGSWTGSTLCSAISGNRVRAVAIDNWSQFGGPKEVFLENLRKFKTPEVDLTVIEDDFRNVNFKSIMKHCIYLFDGPHTSQDQYDGIALAKSALLPCFVLIVDDWNWRAVRDGTLESLTALNMSVLYSVEVRTTLDDSHAAIANELSDWHNGYFIAVIQQARHD
jgi:hypothetical protein